MEANLHLLGNCSDYDVLKNQGYLNPEIQDDNKYNRTSVARAQMARLRRCFELVLESLG